MNAQVSVLIPVRLYPRKCSLRKTTPSVYAILLYFIVSSTRLIHSVRKRSWLNTSMAVAASDIFLRICSSRQTVLLR